MRYVIKHVLVTFSK